ncbi:Peptide transporter family 1 [Folsomia candida]|uniref:Peptide transporter family 1 n=1 Tax=Folsomia candida TaxID=158441 RepID=A0A226DHG4_FOLCA|nr:Peptide transporter family 1 [Folsomia candida]
MQRTQHCIARNIGKIVKSLDPETSKVSLPYPKGVAFIALTELAARFAYYGSRAVLTIYMRNVLSFSEDLTTTIYHAFLMLCYTLPVIWGVVADSFLGMYKTLWIVNLLFLVGSVGLTAGSFPGLMLPPVEVTILSLILMAVGTGGMKPCLAPFGGEQFTLPQQALRLQQFFSIFFVATTIGNMLSTVVTPVLRKDVSCLGRETCYPLAFSVPCVMMLFAVVIFLAGKPFYKRRKPEGNMLVKVVMCMKHAIGTRWKSSSPKKAHWLDHAEGKFDPQLIQDLKGLLGLLIYYAPFPMFYALLEQLGSRWTLQATKMWGRVGHNFYIKPDQMQVSNAIFMFLFTPIFEGILYPVLAKVGLLKRPLQRIGLGLFLAGMAFVAAGLVELRIQNNQPAILSVPEDSHALNLINTLPPACPIQIRASWRKSDGTEAVKLVSFEENSPPTKIILLEDEHVRQIVLEAQITEIPEHNECPILKTDAISQRIESLSALQEIFILLDDTGLSLTLVVNKEPRNSLAQSREGNSKIQLVLLTDRAYLNESNLILESDQGAHRAYIFSFEGETGEQKETEVTMAYSNILEVPPGRFSLLVGDKSKFDVNLAPGAIYSLLLDRRETTTSSKFNLIPIVAGNEVHILWQIPQYVLMAWAQILFIVSGMEFSYTQAPGSMKSVLAALWNLMNSFGNVIVILSVSVHSGGHYSQAMDYFQFAGMMGVNVIFFTILAVRYKYVEH